MGDVINLNRYRKDKQAAERARRANEKRVRFGLPKSERGKNAAERALEARRLDVRLPCKMLRGPVEQLAERPNLIRGGRHEVILRQSCRLRQFQSFLEFIRWSPAAGLRLIVVVVVITRTATAPSS